MTWISQHKIDDMGVQIELFKNEAMTKLLMKISDKGDFQIECTGTMLEYITNTSVYWAVSSSQDNQVYPYHIYIKLKDQ